MRPHLLELILYNIYNTFSKKVNRFICINPNMHYVISIYRRIFFRHTFDGDINDEHIEDTLNIGNYDHDDI